MSGSPVRLTFLTVMPSPYMRDLFAAMHADGRFRLKVLYLEREAVAAPGVYWQDRPLPEYASVLPGRWHSFLGARVHVNRQVVEHLRAGEPQVAVIGSGYNSLTAQLAMAYLTAARRPWVFWAEVPGFERRGVGGQVLRWMAQRPAVWLPSAVAGIGRRAADVYRQLTPDTRPVWNIPYACETTVFRPSGVRPVSDPRFLYCGQLVPRKGVDLLVRSFVRVASEFPNSSLTLVGGGPMRAELEGMVPVPIRPRVRFAGFREPGELPAFYAAADVFVLPSRHDGWGLVVNQAVAAGLPVIATAAVGAAVDLVGDGINGRIVPADNEDSLTDALRGYAATPNQAVVERTASLAAAERVSLPQVLNRWHELLRAVAARHERRLPDRLTL